MERSSQLKPFTVRIFITGYKSDDVYTAASYTNLASLDGVSLAIFCKENKVPLDENGYMSASEDQTWVDVPIPHRGGYAFEHSDDGDDEVLIRSFFERCQFENVEKFKAITGVMGPIQVIEASSLVDYIRQTNAYERHKMEKDPGWGEDTYKVLMDKYGITREMFDPAMDHIMKGFGMMLNPFPCIEVQSGSTGIRLSQAMGGRAMTQEMLARIFSTGTDCFERRNSQLMPIYETFLHPVPQDEMIDREVARRFLERGLDPDGNPLTPEEIQERMNAPLREVVERARARMEQNATPEQRLDALADEVKNLMTQPTSQTPVDPDSESESD